MPLSEKYRHQVALLIETIPFVAAEPDFALKGGTAINLFHRDMPRLSVDIDLTYLPVAPRPESLAAIDAAMKRMAAAIRKGLPGARVTDVVNAREKIVTKLTVQKGDAQIKIEVTPVIRGCVFEPELRDVSPSVEETFGFAQMKVVSFADLYAGKLVAALDRQHPRDLFDVPICSPTKASRTISARRSSSTSLAMTGRFPRSWFLAARTSSTNSRTASRV
jgi:predicted nucleotidyltransferase component of viral defense system